MTRFARTTNWLVAAAAVTVLIAATSCSKPVQVEDDAYKSPEPKATPPALTEGTGPGDSMRTNNVILFTLNGFPNGFQLTGYKVSSGQPWGGVTTSSTQYEGEPAFIVTAKAGRHKTTDVADWFKDQVGGGQMLGAKSSSSSPDQLNFAICGNLTFGDGFEQFTRLGQGNDSVENDWWVGGPAYNQKGNVGGMAALCTTGQSQTVGFTQTPPNAAADQYFIVNRCY